MNCELCGGKLGFQNRSCNHCGARYKSKFSILGKALNFILVFIGVSIFISSFTTFREYNPLWFYSGIMMFSLLAVVLKYCALFKTYHLDLSDEQTAYSIKNAKKI